MKTIAYLGVPGSYSHSAAISQFGPDQTYRGFDTFTDIFRAGETGEADYCTIPIENTLAGSLYQNYDYLYAYNLTVCAERTIHIDHHLLGIRKHASSLKIIKNVLSHPKALEQCEIFFHQHPEIKKGATTDTGQAAKIVSQKNDITQAAIASEDAASIYHLSILKRSVSDNPRNYTRFLFLTKKHRPEKNANKCSLILTLPHTPGSLYTALSCLATAQANLTKIESRPILGKPFEYVFYIDFLFDPSQRSVIIKLLKNELITHTNSIKLLGFYQSKPYET